MKDIKSIYIPQKARQGRVKLAFRTGPSLEYTRTERGRFKEI